MSVCDEQKVPDSWVKIILLRCELYHGQVKIGHVEELREPRQTGIWQCSDEMYIVHSAHESAICCLWMIHCTVIFYAYKISWNKELFTTSSYSISFGCLIFPGAFQTSRLPPDACRFLRFNSLRGFYTSFILKATISRFSQAVGIRHPATRCLPAAARAEECLFNKSMKWKPM